MYPHRLREIKRSHVSSFAWLDFSESDRKRALDVIDLFRDKGTVDELGLGIIRDAIADVLFPGTSTIMTRARYYLFVPWIYLELERKKIPSAEVARRARDDEIRLIEALLNGGEKRGVIGIEARKNLKRLPSTIYWQGLGILRIRRFPGFMDRYHRILDDFYRNGGHVIKGDDGHVVTGGNRRNWDPNIPPLPKEFLKLSSFTLTTDEAEYLRERIIQAAPDSLFAFLVRNPVDASDITLPWEHPLADDLPTKCGTDLAHARCFSEAMHGASLIYNLMLAERKEDDALVAGYRERLDLWSDLVSARMSDLQHWARGDFWQLATRAGARVTQRTRFFVDGWLDALIGKPPQRLLDDKRIRLMIKDRETKLKGSLARLVSRRALEGWGGASSSEPLDYRWNRPTKAVLADIASAETSR
jgi:hypothetical protein